MIKVIASDMDGTLLDERHRLRDTTVKAVQKACDAGLRFVIVSGRTYPMVLSELKGKEISYDCIAASGAEVRNAKGEVMFRAALRFELCRRVYDVLKKYGVNPLFLGELENYQVGTPEELRRCILERARAFHVGEGYTDEELQETEWYERLSKETIGLSGLEKLQMIEKPVYKVMAFSQDIAALGQIDEELARNIPEVASASSFITNLEITDVRAQKGPVLKWYIESLGYTMDEVMVLGDSMNDYSMLSMDFGATVAMANSMPQILAAAKYRTKSNEEDGVAYAIEEVLRRQG